MNSADILVELDQAILSEDRFIEQFEEMFGSDIITRLHVGAETRERVTVLLQTLLTDSRRHKDLLEIQRHTLEEESASS